MRDEDVAKCACLIHADTDPDPPKPDRLRHIVRVIGMVSVDEQIRDQPNSAWLHKLTVEPW